MKKYLIFTLFVLCGCELVVDIDDPYPGPQLTLNSLFNPDSLFVANLTMNRSPLSVAPEYTGIENGKIVIYENNNAVDTLENKGYGFYRSRDFRPQAGKKYSIKAIVENFQEVTSTSETPSKTEIIAVSISSTVTNQNEIQSTIKLKFKDDPKHTNFYEIQAFDLIQYINSQREIINIMQPIVIELDDPSLSGENFNYLDGILLKDIRYSGKEVELPIKAISFSEISPIIILKTLSEDCYRYKVTRDLQQETAGNPFAQPANVYNNITRGFGIFAGYSSSEYKTIAARPEIISISPGIGSPGDHVIITCKNLSSRSNSFTTIAFYSSQFLAYAQIVRQTDTELEVIVPPDAVTGKIFLMSDRQIVQSESDFVVP
jgi:hypothetical protein